MTPIHKQNALNKAAVKSREERIEDGEQNSTKQKLFPSLKELAENAVLNRHGASLIGLIKEDEEAKAQTAVIEYPGKASYPGIAMFKQPLEKKLILVNAIVLAVVQGDLPKAKAQILQNPMLSSLKGEAIDYSGRTIHHVTPFQAALCAWDDEMCEMFAEFMSPEEVTRQYNEIFPKGIWEHRVLQKSFDFSGVVDVILHSTEEDAYAALNNEQNDSLLCKTLNQFRIDFTNCSSEEKIFNPRHLIEAYQLYNTYHNRLNWNQRILFWRQIIGYVQRFLPANIAQDVAQGIYYRAHENEKAHRSFNYRNDKGAIFPLVFDSHSGLGFDHARGIWAGETSDTAGAGVISKLISNKHDALVTLCSQCRNGVRLA